MLPELKGLSRAIPGLTWFFSLLEATPPMISNTVKHSQTSLHAICIDPYELSNFAVGTMVHFVDI